MEVTIPSECAERFREQTGRVARCTADVLEEAGELGAGAAAALAEQFMQQVEEPTGGLRLAASETLRVPLRWCLSEAADELGAAAEDGHGIGPALEEVQLWAELLEQLDRQCPGGATAFSPSPAGARCT